MFESSTTGRYGTWGTWIEFVLKFSGVVIVVGVDSDLSGDGEADLEADLEARLLSDLVGDVEADLAGDPGSGGDCGMAVTVTVQYRFRLQLVFVSPCNLLNFMKFIEVRLSISA